MLLRDFVPCVFYLYVTFSLLLLQEFELFLMYLNACVVTTVAVVILLRNFAPYILHLYICWL